MRVSQDPPQLSMVSSVKERSGDGPRKNKSHPGNANPQATARLSQVCKLLWAVHLLLHQDSFVDHWTAKDREKWVQALAQPTSRVEHRMLGSLREVQVTVIDLFSKQAHFIACSFYSLPSAHKLVKLFLKHIYWLHGIPKRIISDWGVQFMAKF